MNTAVARSSRYKKIVIAISVAVPLVVTALFGVKVEGYDLTFLPPIYATINGITASLLLVAFIAVKNKKITLHERIMKICLLLSAAFLVMYLLYHMTSEPTAFGGVGTLKIIYYAVLISHILLSVAVIPMVLISYLRAWAGDYAGHRKLAKFAFPLWLYVAVSGVIVYLMISPYYG